MRASEVGVLLLFLATGCGDSVAGSSSPSGGSGAFDATSADGSDAGLDADSGSVRDSAPEGNANSDGGDSSLPTDAGTDAAWSLYCPDSPPDAGAPCTTAQENLDCEYGGAWWNVNCDSTLRCVGGVWYSASPGASICFPAPGPNPVGCPVNPSSIVGPCPDAGLACNYEQGAVCYCDATNDAGGTTWACFPNEANCPLPRPRLGATCTVSAQCVYNDRCNWEEDCTNGSWQPSQTSCM